MSTGPSPTGARQELPGRSALGPTIACAWLLAGVTFSVSGRDPMPAGLDVIALAKLAVRAIAAVVLAREIVRGWDRPWRPAVVWCFAPFAVFLAWSLVTVVWSPMKGMSLGQLSGLLVQVMLAAAVALRWRGPADTSDLLRHLCLALTTISGLLVAVDLVDHDVSGLNRTDFNMEASNGLYHPTSAGAIGSLGVLVVVAARMLWGWGWTRTLLVPGVVACGALLVLSHSRMALVMTAVALGLAAVRFTGPRAIAGAAVAAAVLGAAYLAFDPGLAEIDHGRRELTEYFRRGETDEQMSSLNGREELWDAVWAEFLRQPVVGHGYFVTSRTGILDVWSGPTVRTAHNFVLQVLVSTGVVGCLLFTWAMVRPIRAVVRAPRDEERDRVRAFALLLGVWFLGWGQLCESFLGPVQPESVVFYSVLGLAVAQVGRPGREWGTSGGRTS